MSRAAEARVKLDKAGTEAICDRICSGESLTHIANEYGVALSSLLAWIDAESDRSVRVREARTAMGKVWDERAEDAIKQAGDEFELKKARELAQHYRWRATKTAKREYGDQIEHTGTLTLEQLVSASVKPAGESDAP